MFYIFLFASLLFLASMVGTARELHTKSAVGSQRLPRFYTVLSQLHVVT